MKDTQHIFCKRQKGTGTMLPSPIRTALRARSISQRHAIGHAVADECKRAAELRAITAQCSR